MRDWKYWTRNKLQILGGYLPAFNVASKSSSERIYIDLMAGEADNKDRDTGEVFAGSARLALGAEPGFTRLAFCEQSPRKAAELEADLNARFPGDSRYQVYVGDCNVVIDRVLAALSTLNWAPTFAFIDQQAAEVHWSTLEKLSRFRSGKYKVEIWILVSPSMTAKGVAGPGGDGFAERVDRLYGTKDWRRIQAARDDSEITPETYRDEMVNLLRWRLQDELGYTITERIPMMMPSGMPIYDMVFATDHAVGQKIMTSLYEAAARREPLMMAEARQIIVDREKLEKHGQVPLFDPEPVSDSLVAAKMKWTSSEPSDPAGRPWWW